jgi:hypothetical protein
MSALWHVATHQCHCYARGAWQWESARVARLLTVQICLPSRCVSMSRVGCSSRGGRLPFARPCGTSALLCASWCSTLLQKPVLSHMCPITRGYQGNDNEGNEMSMTLHQMMLECSLTGAMSCAGGVPNGLVCHESVDMQPNTYRCYGFSLLNLPLPFFNASQGTII